MSVSLIRLKHFRDNVLDAEHEHEFEEWGDFVDELVATGHELRGEEGEPEDDYKLGFRGSRARTTFLPVTVDWEQPLGDAEADWAFRDRHGADTELRRRCNMIVSGSPAWIILDIDTQTTDEWEELQAVLREEELDALAYSSYSHGKNPEIVKIRLIIRASRAYGRDEIKRVRRGAGRALGTVIDPSCTDPARIFFLPATHPSREELAFFQSFNGGKTLDVDAILRDTPETANEAATRMEIQLGVWDGRQADDDDKLRAEIELGMWVDDVAVQAGGNYRAFCEQATYKFGGYIAAGALDLETTRERMYRGYDEALHRNEDDRSTEYRRKQIDTGLKQGARRPRLPFTEEQQKQIEMAVDKAAFEVLSAQLSSQRPAREVPLEEARESCWNFLDREHYEAMHVDASTVGVGKSFVFARVAAKRARSGLLTVIQTQEHAVGAQTREELVRRDPGVKSVHLYSAASPPPNAPADHKCPRLAEEPELSELIYDFDTPLRKICGTACERKETCPALAAAKKRGEALREAQVVFVSQAGIGQVSDWLEDGAALLTDEQPAPLKQVSIPGPMVDILEDIEHIPGLDLAWSERISNLVKDVRAKREPDEWQCLDDFPVSIEGIRALSKPEDRQLLRAASRLYLLCQRRKVRLLPGGGIEGFLVTQAHQAMLDARESVLVDATPLLGALPKDLRLHRQHVRDPEGVPITRRMLYRAKAGSSAMYGEGWVNERVVTAAVNRALDAHPGEWLFVTFKAVREWLEQHPGLLRRRMQLAHFGAVRGKNTWKNVDGIYTLGTPRFDRESMLQALLGREFVDSEWLYLASAELEQAFGRGRHVSRATPLLMMCEGSLAPLSWHLDNCKVVEHTGE